MPSPAPAHAAAEHKKTAPKLSHMNLPFSQSNFHRDDVHSSQTGVVVTVVLACVGFVVVLVAVGVRRIRNAGRHSRHRRAVAAAAADITGVSDDRQEMEWDNSALTITVNPMEQQMMYDAETVVSGRGTADSDSDEEPNTLQDDHDDDSSDDDDDDDVCEQKMVKTRELEWDDSTLSY